MKTLGKIFGVVAVGVATGAGLYCLKEYIKKSDKEETMCGLDNDYDTIDKDGNAEAADNRDYVPLDMAGCESKAQSCNKEAKEKLDEVADADVKEKLDEAVDAEVETEDLIPEE